MSLWVKDFDVNQGVMSVRILFEDRSVLALEKPYGLPTIPGSSGELSLREIAERLYGRVFVVHRLDKLTSGVVLFAKDPETHRYLCTLFEARRVKKEYVCVVLGETEDEFTVKLPIRKFGSGRMGYDSKGKKAETRFCKIVGNKDYTLLRAYPITGRRHQIRVHLYLKGTPIVGDNLYGQRNIQGTQRLMLHSHRISYLNQQGKFLEICSPIPGEFFSQLG